MDYVLKSVKNASLAAVGLLAIFVGGGVIAVVFKAITWEDLGDWTLKAVLVAIVAVLVSAVVGLVVSSATKK